jgi:RNA polymerase sigma-70 factor (ECF subfamily)
LVQGALVRALDNLDKFESGTNLRAWLFTILRNLYYSDLRKKRREVEDADGAYAARLTTSPNQYHAVKLKDFWSALATLKSEQREALILIGGEGLSYEDAAEICGCAVGTIKSRVNRARSRLDKLLTDEATPPRHWHYGAVRAGGRHAEPQTGVSAGY